MKVFYRLIPMIILLLGNIYVLSAQSVSWAYEVLGFSSEYSEREYSAEQVLGIPSVLPSFGVNSTAWSPKWPNTKEEWIHIGFEVPQKITRIGIAESNNPGSLSMIIAYDGRNNEHIVYRNPDVRKYTSKGRMLNIDIETTSFKCHSLKIILNPDKVTGYNHIDAIGVSASDEDIVASINLASMEFNSEPKRLGRNINSVYGEVHPIISPEGKNLYFTRKKHPHNRGAEDRDDIWTSSLDEDGNWSQSINMGPPLNNSGHNYINSISPDGNMILLGGTYGNHGTKDKLYITINDENGWTDPVELEIDNYYNRSSYNSFHMGVDGKTIIMSLERDDSYGNKDLYVSFLVSGNHWSEPLHLGSGINTAGDEITPFLAADGTTLYFSSNGLSGYGRNDIYISKRLDDTWENWTEPKNLGPKINTPEWDAYYTVDASGENAYFTSYKNTYGEADIFQIKLEELQKPDIVALIKGTVYDASTDAPISTSIEYTDGSTKKNAGYARSSASTGNYRIVLPVERDYDVFAQKQGYYAISENIDLKGITEYQELEMDLYLYPIRKGEVIPLNEIFFEVNSAILKPKSYNELNRVASFLKSYPSVKIEIGGHTNNKCSQAYCAKLSKNRAKAVMDYLSKNHVRLEQLGYRGYGKSNPIDTNKSEAGRKKNQRVEIKIISVG